MRTMPVDFVVLIALLAINSAFSLVVKAPTCNDQSRGVFCVMEELITLSMDGALPMASMRGLGNGTPATTMLADFVAAKR